MFANPRFKGCICALSNPPTPLREIKNEKGGKIVNKNRNSNDDNNHNNYNNNNNFFLNYLKYFIKLFSN